MQEPSHIRALSLVLAFSVVVAGWLLFEYGNHQAEQIVQPKDDLLKWSGYGRSPLQRGIIGPARVSVLDQGKISHEAL